MKSKILLISLLSLFIFSCSSDDEGSETNPIPAEQKFLSKITNDEGTILFSVEYTSDKKVKKTVSPLYQTRYEYDENGLVKELYMMFTGEDTTITYFEHDANGNIIGFAQNGAEYPVEKTNSRYIFPFEDDLLEVDLNANKEIEKIIVSQETQINFFYVEDKLGSASNANRLSIYNCISSPLSFLYYQSIYNFMSMPLEEILANGFSMNYQNEYDEQGFLKKAVVTSNLGEPTVTNLNYEYIQL